MYIHYGIEYNGRLYGWKNKKLYSLPKFKELKKQLFNYSYGYYLNRKPFCMVQLEKITKVISYNTDYKQTKQPCWLENGKE